MPYRILYLEDNEFDVRLVRDKLEQEKFSVILRDVVKRDDFLLELRSFEPDIVLCDNSLPDYDGEEALEDFISHGYEMPFILFTGTVPHEKIVELLQKGATDLITKSNLSRLPHAIHRAIQDSMALSKQKNADIRAAQQREMMLIGLQLSNVSVFEWEASTGYLLPVVEYQGLQPLLDEKPYTTEALIKLTPDDDRSMLQDRFAALSADRHNFDVVTELRINAGTVQARIASDHYVSSKTAVSRAIIIIQQLPQVDGSPG